MFGDVKPDPDMVIEQHVHCVRTVRLRKERAGLRTVLHAAGTAVLWCSEESGVPIRKSGVWFSDVPNLGCCTWSDRVASTAANSSYVKHSAAFLIEWALLVLQFKCLRIRTRGSEPVEDSSTCSITSIKNNWKSIEKNNQIRKTKSNKIKQKAKNKEQKKRLTYHKEALRR